MNKGWPLLAALALAACLDAETMGQLGLSDTAGASHVSPGRVLSKKPIANGNVVVVAPRGYCIDGRAMNQRAGGGFVLIASCETLTGGKVGPAVAPVVMTVTVLPRRPSQTAPTAQELAAALAPARAIEREDGDGLVLVHVASGGDALSPAGDPRHWRAAMEINGHLVTLAIYGPKGGAAAGRAGKRLILELAEALRTASPAKMVVPKGALVPPLAAE